MIPQPAPCAVAFEAGGLPACTESLVVNFDGVADSTAVRVAIQDKFRRIYYLNQVVTADQATFDLTTLPDAWLNPYAGTFQAWVSPQGDEATRLELPTGDPETPLTRAFVFSVVSVAPTITTTILNPL